ncbi:MAG: NAD(P)/FAD-dependent oxidoreductase, partial [Gemmatimonadales bacterium]
MTRFDYLIVGGGMTADAAAHGIREKDSKGSIGIVGSDPHAPYNRPPLTKGLWKGDAPDSIWRKTEETGAQLFSGRRIERLDPAARRVTDDQGSAYEYGTLLLATGGQPRRLPGSPDGVVYFRTLDDYRRIRDLADRGSSFAVIGAGFIGAEIAAALRMHQRDVTMIVRDQGIGARVYPKDLARWLVEYYREKGVTVRLGQGADRIEARNGRFRVHAGKAEPLEVDAVVAGLGIEPNVALAKSAGLEVDDGIQV